MRAIKISIEGKVQGVWFRKYAKTTADRLGVFGTVQNRPDGSVQCFVEGEENMLEKFVECCRIGSPLSQVSAVVVTECAPLLAGSFEVLK